MTRPVVRAWLPAALSPRLTAGTVGTGPKAWDEVACPHGLVAPGVLASGPTGHRADLYSKRQPVAVRPSLPSRSATPPTRLETRTKESNMYASHWVD